MARRGKSANNCRLLVRPSRSVLALASVSQTLAPYELPLAVMPQSLRETLVVVLGWTGAYLLKVAFNPLPLLGYAHLPASYSPPRWWVMLLLGYAPVLILLLRRPNTAE